MNRTFRAYPECHEEQAMMTINTVPMTDPALPDAPAAEAAKPLSAIPREVDLIISAMEAGGASGLRQRTPPRTHWRVQATVRLFIDKPGHPSRTVFSRDIHSRGLGFVTTDRLPLGYGGVVDLPAKDGTIVSIACTVLRCRQSTGGWYEGFIYFNREQTSTERLTG